MKPTPSPTSTAGRRVTGAAAVASAVLLVQSLVWLLLPDLNPYRDVNLSVLRSVLPLPAHGLLLAVVGLLGTVCAGIAALRPDNRSSERTVSVVAPVIVVTLFTATTSMSALSFAGYLVAMALPLAAIVAGVVAAIRAPRARVPVAVAVAVGLGVIVVFRDLILSAFSHNFAAFGEQRWTMWALTITVITIGLWTALTVTAVRGARWTAPVTDWLVPHRRPITVLAALGPLPYALLRLTWLTPWPIGFPDDADAAVAAWGFMLSLGAWMGVVLTLGLIMPWGERFPRWLPGVGGRSVPPAAAIVPGSIVAGLLALAAVPWTVGFLTNPTGGFAVYFFVLPVGYWAVMLTLAVWAYAGHRSRTRPGAPTGPARSATMVR